ncbi:MAG: hypothetical protein LLF94_11415 [Chlamydiales bacterium]|nr:hypothetical protein [Chlamydiales bacterium]
MIAGLYYLGCAVAKPVLYFYAAKTITQAATRNRDTEAVFNETYRRFTQLKDHSLTKLVNEVLQNYAPKSQATNIVGGGTSVSSKCLYQKIKTEKSPDKLYTPIETYLKNPDNNGKKLYCVIKSYIYRNTH